MDIEFRLHEGRPRRFSPEFRSLGRSLEQDPDSENPPNKGDLQGDRRKSVLLIVGLRNRRSLVRIQSGALRAGPHVVRDLVHGPIEIAESLPLRAWVDRLEDGPQPDLPRVALAHDATAGRDRERRRAADCSAGRGQGSRRFQEPLVKCREVSDRSGGADCLESQLATERRSRVDPIARTRTTW
jgi:hypothetical protein